MNRNLVMALVACGGLVAAASAENDTAVLMGSPIGTALTEATPEVRRYNDHLTTLASDYMEGRVPGSEGAERARHYVEYYFRQFGLEPAFPDADGNEFASFRDPFDLGGTWEVSNEMIGLVTEAGTTTFAAEDDFVFTGLGGVGEAAGQAVFVGYSIDNGRDGYSSYAEGDDLTGKIAVMFRFEPMDDDGESLWTGAANWSNQASFNNKLRGAIERGAAGVIVINPPGSADPRAQSLARFATNGGRGDVPVFMMTPEAGERLAKAGAGRSLMALRRHADEGGEILPMNGILSLTGEAEVEPVVAENIGAVLRGSGTLADEWIVIGGHMDHLGMGYFGSRSGPGELHPGADDNASGTAGVLLISELLAESMGERPADEDRRSILFIAFDGEESGLNGARHYVRDAIAPIEDHVLMINWDMIGRIENERLTVAGANSAAGMNDFLQPHFERSGLEIVQPRQMSGASDHTAFYQMDVPVLFSIIADFHDDYHTPRDVSWKINRVGAVKTVLMYQGIVEDMAVLPERFSFTRLERNNRQTQGAGGPSGMRVRFGIMPGSYEEGINGIPVAGVTDDGPADKAGVEPGDLLVRWDGQKITDVAAWMGLLARHNPGDEVNIGVLRDGEEVTMTVTLEGR